jgi:hypothetical protein
MRKTTRVIVLTTILAFSFGVAAAQQETEKKKRREGRRKGAAGGAVLGLTLGALAGDASLAAKGAAAGAVAGGVSGSLYDYDQSRQDDRTQMLADSIAGSKAGDPQPGETVGDTGRRHFEELTGQWKLDIWYMGPEGRGKTATGSARGLAAGDNAVRLLYQDIITEGYDDRISGYSLLNYQPSQGFFLENNFTVDDEVVRAVGEYHVDRNAYDFYLTDPTTGEMLTGGILRSNVRIEIRMIGPTLWIAEAFTMIDGEETKVQTYRFTRPE